ncbi:hypothetical protein [Corallococcus exiguus]|uniref:Uncharacterized protein n=1 Tax=Corallococcus exiguus TaxID=83462 RepID=A0A7X5BR55_9BACT|nr:hypothetical protein [Corallococcus exiguus]NBC40454.1 hypothetical protein [Corallococcus exiguus]TNV64062.1 hypothetical protein FH620_13570 [Corallococcus exiguus]
MSDGALSEAMALRIAREMPLLALEDVVGRVGFERFQDAELDPLVTETQLAVLEGKTDLVWSRQELLERWMQLRWGAHGHHSMVMSDALARTARSTELQGYNCDDVTVRGRTLHVPVPPVAGITLPDATGRDWPVADMLIASEGDGQQWCVLLEAPGDTPQQQTVAAIRIDWPAGVSVGEALDRFDKEAAPGVDWRAAWRWILGVMLARQPPPAQA